MICHIFHAIFVFLLLYVVSFRFFFLYDFECFFLPTSETLWQASMCRFQNAVSLLLCDLPLTMAAPACDRLVAKAPVRFAAFKYAIDACLALGRFRELACATFRHVLQELGTSPPLKKADMMEVISSDPKIPPAIDKWLPENYIGRDIFIVALYSASRSADDKERLDGSDFVWQG
eukprot:GEMP01039639.1.p1 GENE.GEMP01039639.1~~GEMP01039639.1.p1  ORF type:complete len:175 (+),score=24.08 GEMP01039639.1:499-1023(+)